MRPSRSRVALVAPRAALVTTRVAAQRSGENLRGMSRSSRCLAGTFAAMALLTASARLTSSAPASASANSIPFEISSNKPWVQVSLNGSPPQWFILDTGASGGTIIAKECAERLGLGHGGETATQIGAGAGVSVGISTASGVTVKVGADTLASPEFRVFSLAHVSPFEGRRLDGLLGEDFLRRHVVELDYTKRMLRVIDPATYAPPSSGVVIPISLDTGLAVAEGAVTPAGGTPIPCRLVIDTGVRTTLVLYHPFVVEHHLLDPSGRAITATIGGGAGGETRGDLARLDSLRIGGLSFAKITAIYSRDTVGVFAGTFEAGIVGGELLRRCRVTFDYPHSRLILEPHDTMPAAFEYDMSGLFLVSPGPDHAKVVVFSVADRTPAAELRIQKGDEIVAINGTAASEIGLDGVRGMLRKPARYRLKLARGAQQLDIQLTTRRLV
jgi:hypothetical protein